MDNNNKGEGMSMDELVPHFNRIDQELSLLKALSERREPTKYTVGCRDRCGWVHFKEQEIERINESHAKAIAHHHDLHRQSLSQCNELKVEVEKLNEEIKKFKNLETGYVYTERDFKLGALKAANELLAEERKRINKEKAELENKLGISNNNIEHYRKSVAKLYEEIKAMQLRVPSDQFGILKERDRLKAQVAKLEELLKEQTAHHYEHHAGDAWVTGVKAENKKLKEENKALKAELSKTRETLHGRIHDLSTDNLRLRTAIKEIAKEWGKATHVLFTFDNPAILNLVKISKEQPK